LPPSVRQSVIGDGAIEVQLLQAASFEGSAGDVLGLKSVKVSEWQGKRSAHVDRMIVRLQQEPSFCV
jgi:hypothetical protein